MHLALSKWGAILATRLKCRFIEAKQTCPELTHQGSDGSPLRPCCHETALRLSLGVHLGVQTRPGNTLEPVYRHSQPQCASLPLRHIAVRYRPMLVPPGRPQTSAGRGALPAETVHGKGREGGRQGLPWWPLLVLGQLSHAGRGGTAGLGRYVLR